jgi:shikimate dehydrogenase
MPALRLVFDDGKAPGYDAGYTGFIAAFTPHFAGMPAVAMIGAGGVGKAIAFGLLALSVSEIRIFDVDHGKAKALAASLNEAGGIVRATCHHELASALNGADGVINCTPFGMTGYPGNAVTKPLLASCGWAFDAVHTPVQTEFKSDAESVWLQVLSGYELFFNQGVQAIRIFASTEPADLNRLHELPCSA